MKMVRERILADGGLQYREGVNTCCEPLAIRRTRSVVSGRIAVSVAGLELSFNTSGPKIR